MRTWLILVGGMVIWMFHFLGSYVIASLLPGAPIARWLVLSLTATSLLMIAVLMLCFGRRLLRSSDDLTRWTGGLAASGSFLAGTAITYQVFTLLLA